MKSKKGLDKIAKILGADEVFHLKIKQAGGPLALLAQAHEVEQILAKVSKKLKCTVDQVPSRLDSMLDKLKQKEKQVEELKCQQSKKE